ncbi:MAG: S8 family peptidase [Nostoc sp.]|uniref:S8 family peptidase n=1 Tax=Nostoc sp. TaxID=1180 RepID=UPI002FF78C87
MINDDTNNNVLSNKQLNVTSISSLNSFNTKDDYSLNLGGRSSYNSADADVQLLNNADSENSSNATATAFTTQNYNSTNGYGLINAAAAVAKATGKNTFADVPDLGGNNWGANLIKAPEAWAQGYTGKGVVVAVVDTGVDYNHEDLKDNIWTNPKEIAGNAKDNDGNGYANDIHGWNFVDNNNNVLDDNGHGTHVSGTIAGENNNYGVTGIAYDAKIMPVKVLDDSGSGSYISIAKGIRYAVDNGANVINLSLGGGSSNRTLESAINYASSKGVIVVMAAGNDGSSSPAYPARYASKSGIAVGAVDSNNNMADFSNRSGTNEISYVTAPGVNIYSSVPNNQYATYSGTSMAAPHVAGVVALMLSANHNLTDAQVRQIVTETAGNSTQTTTSSLNISNVSSIASQVIADTAGNNTQTTISSFNLSNVSSLARQVMSDGNLLRIYGETANYLTSQTVSNFNSSDFGSLMGQAMSTTGYAYAETAKYLTPETIASWNNSDFSLVIGQAMSTTGYAYAEMKKYLTSDEGNNGLANSELRSQFQNDEKILGSVNVDSNEDENNLDVGKFLDGIPKQMEQYRKFLGIA